MKKVLTAIIAIALTFTVCFSAFATNVAVNVDGKSSIGEWSSAKSQSLSGFGNKFSGGSAKMLFDDGKNTAYFIFVANTDSNVSDSAARSKMGFSFTQSGLSETVEVTGSSTSSSKSNDKYCVVAKMTANRNNVTCEVSVAYNTDISKPKTVGGTITFTDYEGTVSSKLSVSFSNVEETTTTTTATSTTIPSEATSDSAPIVTNAAGQTAIPADDTTAATTATTTTAPSSAAETATSVTDITSDTFAPIYDASQYDGIAETTETEATTAAAEEEDSSDNITLVIIIAAIVALAVIIAIVTIIIKKKEK